jgi:hypothetical protein
MVVEVRHRGGVFSDFFDVVVLEGRADLGLVVVLPTCFVPKL